MKNFIRNKIINNKSLRIISTLLVVILMGFLIIKSYNNNSINAATSETKNSFTVKVINYNDTSGKATISLGTITGEKDDQGKDIIDYTNTHETFKEVQKGTKIKISFEEGLKNDYKIFMWANMENNILSPIMSTEDESINYTKDYLKLTITKDVLIYIYTKQTTDKVVYFYNSSVEGRKNLLGVDVVPFGKDASFDKYKSPSQKGFDFIEWSDSLKEICTDTELYPLYDSNIKSVFRDYYPLFFKGLGVTLLLSVISVFCALFLGILLCLARLSNVKLLNILSSAYVEIIRGVPLLLQLLVIYVVLGPTKVHIGNFFTTEVISCLLALFINSGAYSSEIFRSGIQAVDKGQNEAGRALGMSKWQVMLKIVIPQGIKNSLPAIGNELVSIIKETSLAVSVDASIGELMSVRKQITAATYINLPPYIIVAIIYFCVTFTLSKLIGYLEKRLNGHEH